MEDDRAEFAHLVDSQVGKQGSDARVLEATREWMAATQPHQYSYHFNWLGLPIIQYPPDIVAVQELIWELKPDLVIETGIARGGSLLLSASILALLELADAREAGTVVNPAVPRRRVLGIDIDIRAHNRQAIEQHPLADRITMLQGSSVDPAIVEQVRAIAADRERVLVMLDSNHTHEHVLAELEAYAPLVSPGSYCIVFDTIIEDLPADTFPDRPWGPGDNPKTAVRQYLNEHREFVIDLQMDGKLLISVAPEGYLSRIPHSG